MKTSNALASNGDDDAYCVVPAELAAQRNAP